MSRTLGTGAPECTVVRRYDGTTVQRLVCFRALRRARVRNVRWSICGNRRVELPIIFLLWSCSYGILQPPFLVECTILIIIIPMAQAAGFCKACAVLCSVAYRCPYSLWREDDNAMRLNPTSRVPFSFPAAGAPPKCMIRRGECRLCSHSSEPEPEPEPEPFLSLS